MKKMLRLALAALFFLPALAMAQTPTVTIPHVVESPGTVNIPVYVDFDGADVRSFDMTFNFLNSVLVFQGVDNVYGTESITAPVSGTASPIKVAWENSAGTSFDNGVFFELVFNYVGGSSPIGFDNPNTIGYSALFLDGSTTPLGDTIFTDGSITQEVVPVPVSGLAMWIGLGLILGFLALRAIRIL